MLSRLPRVARAGLAGLALSAGALLVTASPAAAEDSHPCVVLNTSKPGPYCPLSPLAPVPVPVYAAPFKDSPIIGYLDRGGDANWFLYQTKGGRFDYRGFTNYFWAYTLPDRWTRTPPLRQMGFVPEVYFRGGHNDEPDGTDRNSNLVGPLKLLEHPRLPGGNRPS
jgi:hypothetical protein